ncbi:MAG: cadherin-like beta sandwich domain-containing protein, partial [Oscillospiraceae bacterium]|nr:cadherin-like beta sandwich domain-containing protein [Oscillospiraceae bacterium]
MRTKKHIKRILALLLILVMTLGMLPMSALAGYEQAETAENSGENITVFVSLENTTFPGGAWSGTRLDRVPVNVPAGSTMMHAVVTAFAQHQISESGSAANFIETIDGLSWHVHPMGGWMMTLNDWFINAGAQAITVSSGDEIRVLFTIAFGEDIGGSWSNNDTSLRELTFSAGELYPVFNSATLEYTLTLPEGTDRVTVTPTAANKNFQVRTNVGGVVYQRSQAVPVTNGTVIVVGVGDPSWPTMNDPPFELTEYRITVYIPSQPPEEGPDNSAVYENGWLIVNIAYENGTGPSLRATIQEALTRAPFNQVSPYYDYSVIERLQITGYMHVYDFYINANVRDLFRGTGAGVNARALLSGLVELDLSGVPGIVGQRTNAQGNPLLGNFLNAAPTQAIQHMASLERLRLSSSIRVSGNFARDNLMLSTLAFDNQPFTEGLFDFTGIGNFNDTFLRASAEGQTSGGTFTFANTRPQAALFPAETGAGAIIPQGFFNNAATLREVHFYSATAPTLYNLNTFNLGSAIARPVAFVPDANAGGYDVDMFRNNFSNVISRDAVSVDRTELRAIIAEAQALEANAFTAASWAAMQAVLTSAQAAYAETAATQEELDGAVAALRSAINALMVYGDDITFIDAPYGATVGVFRKGTLHFAEFETFPMSVDSVLSGEGREIWRAAIPLNTPLHIEAFIPGQTAKQAVFFTAQSHGTTITVNPIALDDWIPGRGEAWHDANVVTNLGDTGTLNLPVGGTFNLDTIRVWQAMAGITANYFIEPEYIFEVFGDSISVAPIGAPGRQQLRITADSPGVSVIKITYNPVEYFQMGIGTLWFDAIDPRNALAVVVNVAGGSDFDTGITVRNDFDTWYFDASAGYREFTFT